MGSMQGGKVFICTTAQAAPLANAAAYAALVWVEIKGVGNMGQIGTSTNILNYPTWGDTVVQKAKGLSNAGDPTLELLRIPNDAGQLAIAAAALTNLNYAIKVERNDKLTGGGTKTIIYNRGLVAGPARPQGANEDFDVDVYTLAFQDLETVVPAT